MTLGFVGYSLSSILGYEAIHYSTTINVSLINTFTPIMIAVIGYILYREPISRFQSLGLILSLTGVFWIIFQGELAQLLRFKVNTGDLFMIINVSTWPIFPVLYKYKASDLPRLLMLAWNPRRLVIIIPPVIVENLIVDSAWIHQVQ